MADSATTCILMTFLSVIFLVGVPGNLLIIIVYWRKPHKTSVHVLITGLAFADFFACLLRPVSMVYWIMDSSGPSGFGGKDNNMNITKSVYVLSNFQTISSSLFLTAAIAFDRYDAVCRPHNRLLTAHRARIIVKVCISLSFLLSIPVASLIFVWRRNPNVWVTIFATVIPCVTYGSVLLVSIILYGKLFCTIRTRAKVRACGVEVIPCSSTEHSGNPYQSSASIVNGEINNENDESSHRVTSSSVEMLNASFGAHSLQAGARRTSNSQMLDVFLASSESTGGSQNNAIDHTVSDNHRAASADLEETSAEGVTESTSFFSQACRKWKPNECCRKPPASLRPSTLRRTNQNGADTHGKTTRMLLITTMVFFVTWFPALFVNLLPLYTTVTSDAGIATVVFIKNIIYINNAFNPFIYGLGNKHFRTDCVKILRNLGCGWLRRCIEKTSR